MSEYVVSGLGWPEELTVRTANREAAAYDRGFSDGETHGRYLVEQELIEFREQLSPEWSVKRAIWNFAVLVAKGHFVRRA